MSFSNMSGRFFAAVALAAVFFVAVPAEAADGRGSAPGLLERLIGWIVGINMAGATGTSHEHDGPYIDPNGGGRTGSCEDPAGCGTSQPVPDASQGGS